MIINAVTETTNKGEPANADFLWLMAEQLNLNIPHVADAAKAMYKYASGTTINLPFHVAVDLRSMKIVLAKGGVTDAVAIEQLARSTLLGNP
jgi:hypothetical protein